jgi:hypothetical protein
MATIIFFRNTWLCKESFLLIIFTPKVHLFWPERTRITDGDPQPHAPDFYRCHHPDDPDRSLPSQIWKTMLNPSILPIKCCHTVKLQIFNDLQHDFILCCSTFSILFYSFFRSDQVTADFAPPIPPWAAPSEIMWRKGNAYQPMYIYIIYIDIICIYVYMYICIYVYVYIYMWNSHGNIWNITMNHMYRW